MASSILFPAMHTTRDSGRSPFALLLILSRRNSGEGWRKRFSSTTLWRRSKAGTCRLSRKWPTSGRRNPANAFSFFRERSEEHTSELQSLTNLVCRLLLEKKKKKV